MPDVTVDDAIYPPHDHIFKVFEMNVHDIRVVLLGQDPYHGGQAHGLSFSVPDGVPIPPSLRNIFKELKHEFPERKYEFSSGNLTRWANHERIFLLNASLTVEKHKPGSHMSRWKAFTNAVIAFISEQNPTCVFLLLGNFAKEKEVFIRDKSRIVYGVHPSPLSASRGFFGSNVFRQVEEKVGQMDWSV
jgi:uracil-DNA glycosylase